MASVKPTSFSEIINGPIFDLKPDPIRELLEMGCTEISLVMHNGKETARSAVADIHPDGALYWTKDCEGEIVALNFYAGSLWLFQRPIHWDANGKTPEVGETVGVRIKDVGIY